MRSSGDTTRPQRVHGDCERVLLAHALADLKLYALPLHEAGMIKSSPQMILAQPTGAS